MSISKKLRFGVFKRDGFQCAYCGKSPPEIILEVDHVEPKSKGGNDDINNLLTACFDCNRGKRNIPKDIIPNQLQGNVEILKEKELQLLEYKKLIKKQNDRKNKEFRQLNEVYNSYFQDYILSTEFRERTIKRFLDYLPISELIKSMHIACQKGYDLDRTIRYFCGICWNNIRNQNGKD